MEVNISAKHMELTDALKNHIEDRIARIKKYTDSKLYADIHLGVEKHRNHIHATVKNKAETLNSEAQDPDSMYKAIDMCVDKLEKQMRRAKKSVHHDKKVGKEKAREGQIAEVAPPSLTEEEVLQDLD